ncbi:MAG: YjbQ family protein [Firmicutes bacterium]|nr:YjbQ family protein [Bacillota bacterium]
MEQFSVETRHRCQLIPITSEIRRIVRQSQVKEGICVVFCPHTTAGLTINENADPDVAKDLVYLLEKIVPANDPNYRHLEGNTAAHMQASLLGSSVHLIISDGELKLGTWQGVYFAEFDGPRIRKVYVQIIS